MKKLVIYYFLFLFFLLSIFVSGVLDSIDSFQYLAVARNIYYKGKPTVPPYEYNTKKNVHMNVIIGKNGDTYSTTGLGFSLAFLPAVALTDLVYKTYNVAPVERFPLENDWLILMTASFTNAFFGALMGVVLYIYLKKLKLEHIKALLLSLAGIFTTNLFVYTKHLWAHMMMAVFLVLSFLMIKYFSESSKGKYLIYSGFFFGIALIAYNLSSTLSFIPLVTYYILLTKPKLYLFSLRLLFKHMSYFLFGILPFILIFFWFENLRVEPLKTEAPKSEIAGKVTIITDQMSTKVRVRDTAKADNEKEYKVPTGTALLVEEGQLISAGQQLTSSPMNIKKSVSQQFMVPIPIFFEGIFGQLFSPGRSIFLYSPMLLMIIFFWHKIKKDIFPEFIVFFVMLALYIPFYALQFTYDPFKGYAPLWHGEVSWGPRYLMQLIPFGLLIVGGIYKTLSRKTIYFVLYPLLIIGLYIEILGVLMPYQTKYQNLEKDFYINGTQYTEYLYSDLLPRYNPVILMSKNLVKLGQNFPKTFDHGIYNVKYYDGIDFPFNVGSERWRSVEGKGYISFDNNLKNPVKELTFGVINHPVSEASESAKLQFTLNNQPLLDKPFELNITQRELIKVSIKENLVKSKDNQLMIEVDYGKPEVLSMHKQIFGLQSFDINNQKQNMESIDVPYVSSLGPKMGAHYQNWGGTNKDPWKTWDIHTQTFERLPDFWWIRNLYYWDIPKKWILIPFVCNLILLVFFGYKSLPLRKMK